MPSETAILEFLDNPGLSAQLDQWVSDLLDDEEDEAELPARAYRAPVVAAAAVEPGARRRPPPPALLPALCCCLGHRPCWPDS